MLGRCGCCSGSTVNTQGRLSLDEKQPPKSTKSSTLDEGFHGGMKFSILSFFRCREESREAFSCGTESERMKICPWLIMTWNGRRAAWQSCVDLRNPPRLSLRDLRNSIYICYISRKYTVQFIFQLIGLSCSFNSQTQSYTKAKYK